MEQKETVIYEYRLAGYSDTSRIEWVKLPVRETAKRYELTTVYSSPFSMNHQWNKRDEGIIYRDRYLYLTQHDPKQAKDLFLNELKSKVEWRKRELEIAQKSLQAVETGQIKEYKLDI